MGSGNEEGRLRPRPLEVGMTVSEFLERAFLGSTARQLATAAGLLVREVLRDPETVVGLSLDAEILAGGAGVASLAPLLRGGYIDWAAVTGENLYYDTLYALGTPFYQVAQAPPPPCEDCGGGIVLRSGDHAAGEHSLREIFAGVDFQHVMGSAEMHDRIGSHLRAREKAVGVDYPSLVTTAHEAGVPLFDPAPVDNALGSLMARLELVGNRLAVDPSADLNHAAAILNSAFARGASCAVWCLGRGAASNFALNLPRHLAALVGQERAPGYRARIRMAGRSHPLPSIDEAFAPGGKPAEPQGTGETPPPATESGPPSTGGNDAGGAAATVDLAVSTDLSVALPLLTAYILDRVPPRPPKRLGGRRSEMLDRLRQDHAQALLRRPV